jgi:hypothetical protein
MTKTMNALQAQLKAVAQPAPAPIRTAKAEQAEGKPSGSRAGKVHLGGWLSADFKRSLLMVKAQTNETTEQILARALNEAFRAAGVPVVGE